LRAQYPSQHLPYSTPMSRMMSSRPNPPNLWPRADIIIQGALDWYQQPPCSAKTILGKEVDSPDMCVDGMKYTSNSCQSLLYGRTAQDLLFGSRALYESVAENKFDQLLCGMVDYLRILLPSRRSLLCNVLTPHCIISARHSIP
jgi:hypothetical protein